MKITHIKTTNGFRLYGNFCSVMDINKNGVVTYSNLNSDSQAYISMVNFYRATIKA